MSLTRDSQWVKKILTFLRDGHDHSRSEEEWKAFDSDPSVQFDPYMLNLEQDGYVRREPRPNGRYVLTDAGKQRLAELEELETDNNLIG